MQLKIAGLMSYVTLDSLSMADVVQNFFYAFNRDPFTAKNLFQHFVTRLLRAGFSPETVGRCKCANGYAWEHNRVVAEPPQFIQKEAKINKWDCAFQAYVFARDYARAAHPHRQKGPWAASLQTIIDRCTAMADEDEEHLNFGEQEEIPF